MTDKIMTYKYTTKITVQNDTVPIVKGAQFYYDAENDIIHDETGEITSKKLGIIDSKTPNLDIIRERQRQLNAHKGIGTAVVGLDENYNREVHNDISTLIAEELEIRHQYKLADTPEKKAAFFEKYGANQECAEYIAALKDGRIDPNTQTQQQFMEEMAFIKTSATNYCVNQDTSSHSASTIAYLSAHPEGVKSNPEAYKEEVEKMYQIGGFDFNTVEPTNLKPLSDDATVQEAENLLSQGADPQKVSRFIGQGLSLSQDTFKAAEELDVSGLSKEQASTILSSAIMASRYEEAISESLCLGDQTVDPVSNYIVSQIQDEAALYVDTKLDILEKQGKLSANGNNKKYKKLMAEAKKVTLDAEGWYNSVEDILSVNKDPNRADEAEQLRQRVKQYQGQKISIDDYLTADQFKLPFEEQSVEEVVADIDERQENALLRKKQQDLQRVRASDPYEVEIMDLDSPVLGDEFKGLDKESSTIDHGQLAATMHSQQGETVEETLATELSQERFAAKVDAHDQSEADTNDGPTFTRQTKEQASETEEKTTSTTDKNILVAYMATQSQR
jgi:hypothetical protein